MVGKFAVTANAVGFTNLAVQEDGLNGGAMVFDMEPVANVFAGNAVFVGIELDLLTASEKGDGAGDDLFGGLVGTVVVGAVADGDVWKTVGAEKTSDGKIGGSFADGIGTIGVIRITLVKFEFWAVEGQIPKNFIGADLVETGNTSYSSGSEEGKSTHEIGFVKKCLRVRSSQRAVDVGFGGKVDDGINLTGFHDAEDDIVVLNVALGKFVVGIILQIG